MSVQLRVDLSEIEELGPKLARLDTQLQTEIAEGIQIKCKLVKSDAQMKCPVKTGFLRSTIYAKLLSFIPGSQRFLQIVIGAWAHYARFQEFGTRHIAPRMFIRKAFRERWPEIKTFIDYIIRKVIGEVGQT